MNSEFVKRLTDIVEANLADEDFGVEGLVRGMGISHTNLHRKLKAISNQTISQFIREIRLKKARELLLMEDLTVSEISYRVGFGSPTYFNNASMNILVIRLEKSVRMDLIVQIKPAQTKARNFPKKLPPN